MPTANAETMSLHLDAISRKVAEETKSGLCDLRAAFMSHLKEHNKDNKEAEAKFKEISEAYDILKDEQKRAAYDRFGHDAFTGGMGNAAGGGPGFSGFSGGGSFSDIFEDLFSEFTGGRRQGGGAGAQSSAARGSAPSRSPGRR